MNHLVRELFTATFIGMVVLSPFGFTAPDRIHSFVAHSDPVAVASRYIRLMHKEEFESVKAISTPESHALLDLFTAFGLLADDLLENLEQTGSPGKSAETVEQDEIQFTILRTEVNADVAHVYYVDHDDGSDEEVVMLKLVDGQWLVHIAKEDVLDEGFEFDED